TCANNLHQLALAAHAYQDACDGLTANFAEDPSRSDGSHNLFYGPLLQLLPYLELNNAHQGFSFLYYDSTFPQGTAGITWPAVLRGPKEMNWKKKVWYQTPFNPPPLLSAPPPTAIDQLSCPNPSGSTGIPGQIWGAQGQYQVFRCPSQPFDN